MKYRCKPVAVSFVYALCILFAISRFLYFDSAKMLPNAGVEYSYLAQLTNASVPDSLSIEISPETDLQHVCKLSKTASLAAAPFFWAMLRTTGKSEFSPTLLVLIEMLALGLVTLSLWWLRKFFCNYFDDAYTVFFILVIALATPVYLSFALNGLTSELFEFASISGTLYCSASWHKYPSPIHSVKLLLALSISVFLSPVACFLIPFILLFYSDVYQNQVDKSSFGLIKNRFKTLMDADKLLLAACMLLFFIGLISSIILLVDFSSSNLIERFIYNIELFPQLVLSYRKGVWLFVPFATLAMCALPVYFSQSISSARAVLLSLVAAIFIVLLIGTWWENSSLAIPELNGIFIILVFPVYALIKRCKAQGEVASALLAFYFLACLIYTQFFTWQIGNGILKPQKLTKRYFYSTLFSLQESNDSSISRILSKGLLPSDKLNYISQVILKIDFTSGNEFTILDINNPFHRINSDVEYALSRKIAVNPAQFRRDALLEIRFRYRMSSGLCNTGPFAVADVESSAERYGYQNFFIESDASVDWFNFTAIYKLPEIKHTGDLLNFYIWNNGKCFIDIDDVLLTIYEPTETHTSKEVFLFD